MKIKPGLYRHYKGTLYRVTGWALHTETLEELTIYQQEDDETKCWARPSAMFGETIEYEGVVQPRFRPVHEGE